MIYRSASPDVSIPDVSLPEYVLAQCERTPERPALIDGVTGEHLTYGAFGDAVRRTAAGLHESVPPGAVVGLVSHNQSAFAVALHGILASGAAVAPMNPMLTVDELASQLRGVRADAVVTSVAAADKVVQAAARSGTGTVYALGAHHACRPFAELSRAGGTVPVISPDTVAVLPHSSGTTGISKGVMLTHRNLVANLRQFQPVYRVGAEDVFCAVLPFFHMYGMTLILNAGLSAGATVVTLPRFDLDSYLGAVRRFGVTRAHFAPPVVAALADAPGPDSLATPSLRRALSGGAPLDPDVARRAEARIGCPIRQGYGMTEAGPGTHLVFDDEYDTVPAGSIGRSMPGTECRIVDPVTGTDAAPGASGELWVRGPQVMRGYLDDATTTAVTMVDGWLRTGDLVRVDGDGLFWVVDRLKDLIKYKGYQVAPAELETVLRGHPRVRAAAVTGMAHPIGGEAPCAYVVPDGELTAESLMDWVRARVAPYKQIRAVVFVDEIPLSPSGKVLRRLLRPVVASR
jgi:acyl-CoA synthetase (AMP-forming)/AMP-acid ligase II